MSDKSISIFLNLEQRRRLLLAIQKAGMYPGEINSSKWVVPTTIKETEVTAPFCPKNN